MARIPGKTTGLRPSTRVFDHAAAELYWRNDGGQRRSWRDVAGEFGVTEGAVYRAACREGWHERAYEIEEEARRLAQKRAVKTVAQRIEEDLRLIDAGKLAVARRLQEGTIDADLGDLVALVKLEQVLVGGPSERIAGETAQHRRSLEEIEAELAALEPDQVDAMLAADDAVSARLELPAGEPTTPVEAEADASRSSMPDAVSVPHSEPVEVEAEAVDDDEPDAEDDPAPDGVGFWKDQTPGIGDWSAGPMFSEQLHAPGERL